MTTPNKIVPANAGGAPRFQSNTIGPAWPDSTFGVSARLAWDNLQSFYNFLTPCSASSLILEPMKLLRRTITFVSIVATFIAAGGEQFTANAKCAANLPIAVELQPLQGRWEGFMAGAEAEKITITISGNSLHFHRDAEFWFQATITVPAGKDPRHFHATIKDCPSSQAHSMGRVVGAIFKIEDGTLALADYHVPGEPPKTIESCPSRYVFKKVQLQNGNTDPRKSK